MNRDVRNYRSEGDLFLELAIPTDPLPKFWKLEIEDQGLALEFTNAPLGLLTIRVNPAGGSDVVFTTSMPKNRPLVGTAHFRLVWKRGDHMTLYINDKMVRREPFTPPEIS